MPKTYRDTRTSSEHENLAQDFIKELKCLGLQTAIVTENKNFVKTVAKQKEPTEQQRIYQESNGTYALIDSKDSFGLKKTCKSKSFQVKTVDKAARTVEMLQSILTQTKGIKADLLDHKKQTEQRISSLKDQYRNFFISFVSNLKHILNLGPQQIKKENFMKQKQWLHGQNKKQDMIVSQQKNKESQKTIQQSIWMKSDKFSNHPKIEQLQETSIGIKLRYLATIQKFSLEIKQLETEIEYLKSIENKRKKQYSAKERQLLQTQAKNQRDIRVISEKFHELSMLEDLLQKREAELQGEIQEFQRIQANAYKVNRNQEMSHLYQKHPQNKPAFLTEMFKAKNSYNNEGQRFDTDISDNDRRYSLNAWPYGTAPRMSINQSHTDEFRLKVKPSFQKKAISLKTQSGKSDSLLKNRKTHKLQRLVTIERNIKKDLESLSTSYNNY